MHWTILTNRKKKEFNLFHNRIQSAIMEIEIWNYLTRYKTYIYISKVVFHARFAHHLSTWIFSHYVWYWQQKCIACSICMNGIRTSFGQTCLSLHKPKQKTVRKFQATFVSLTYSAAYFITFYCTLMSLLCFFRMIH